MKERDRKNLIAYILLVVPGFVIYLFIVAYPVFYSLWLSFTDFNPTMRDTVWNYIGPLQYTTMFQDAAFWHALGNNMVVVMISVFGQIPIALVLAYILYRALVAGRTFFQAMVFLPQFISTIVIGVMWKRAFSADGPVSMLIQIFSGDPQAQFTLMLSQNTIMIPIGFALIWMYTGLYVIIFLANLQKMNQSVIEAAMIDGASERQILFSLILPYLSGTIMVSSILAISGSLKGFDLIFAMTTQGVTRLNAEVLPIFMYRTAFQDYANTMRFAYGAAISNIIVVISVGLILFSTFIGRKLNVDEGDKE